MGSGGEDAAALSELIRAELSAIPIAMWGSFFPVQVAVWRFIELRRPGVLGELHAGHDPEPYFKGKGADWFCGNLFNAEGYVQTIEEIMWPIAIELRSKRPWAIARGSLDLSEVPPIDIQKSRRLAEFVLEAADKATASGLIQ